MSSFRGALQINPDLVHAMRIPFEGMLAAEALRKIDIPLVVSVWGNDFTLFARCFLLVAWMTRRAMGRADALPLYFRAGDVLLIPGRAGIVISEAMAFGLPVIVHQGDGAEHDSVQNGVTGFHLSGGGVEGFQESLEFLQTNPSKCARMGAMSRELIRNRFNTENW